MQVLFFSSSWLNVVNILKYNKQKLTNKKINKYGTCRTSIKWIFLKKKKNCKTGIWNKHTALVWSVDRQQHNNKKVEVKNLNMDHEIVLIRHFSQ